MGLSREKGRHPVKPPSRASLRPDLAIRSGLVALSSLLILYRPTILPAIKATDRLEEINCEVETHRMARKSSIQRIPSLGG